MRDKPDHDKKHATKDEYGNVTANNQAGVDAEGKPIDVKPTKHKACIAEFLTNCAVLRKILKTKA